MNIKIGISSHKKFVNKTTPLLVSTLLKSGIKSEDIYIFCGGYEENKSYIKDGINCYTANHNSYEYTSYIEILENKLDYNWFLMHDTCYVGPDFKKLLYEKTLPDADRMCIKSWPPAGMSMGYVKYEYMDRYRTIVLALRNMSKYETVIYEDLITRRMEYDINNVVKYCPVYGDERYEYPPQSGFYGTDTKRIIEYFPQLDLYKLKSNWGQAGTQTNNL